MRRKAARMAGLACSRRGGESYRPNQYKVSRGLEPINAQAGQVIRGQLSLLFRNLLDQVS